MRRNVWKGKTTQQLYKVSTTCNDDHQFDEEELVTVGELSIVWPQIFPKCLHLARIGGPEILLVRKQTCPISHKMDEGL